MHNVLRWAVASAAGDRLRLPVEAKPVDRMVRELFERARSQSRPRDLRRQDHERLIQYAVLGCMVTNADATTLREVMRCLS